MRCAEQGLPGRIVPAKGVEAQFTAEGMQFGTYEPMRPVAIGVQKRSRLPVT